MVAAHAVHSIKLEVKEPVVITEKEIACLRLFFEGVNAPTIAKYLSISEKAVYKRLANAQQKLGARNSREAANIAFSKKLITF